MTKKFRLITGLLAAVLAAVMLSSAVYIAVEANHNCSGEDCAICHQLQVCENLLKSIGPVSYTHLHPHPHTRMNRISYHFASREVT